MVHHRGTYFSAAALLVTAVSFASCGRTVNNAAPRVSTIPALTTTGGSTFSTNLGTYVTDREGSSLTYTVVSGGGSFSGSTYSQMFDTVGTYTVSFSVADGAGKSATSSFDVTVTTADLAVVGQGDDLLLLDTATQKFLNAASATGFSDTHKATLSKGHLVYERQAGTKRLFVYDPNTRQTTVLGDSTDENTAFAAVTTNGRVVFTRTATATPTDSDLYLWNVETGAITAISAQTGKNETNAMVNATNMVFYEREASPADIFVYDPTTDTSTAVATESTVETIRAVLPNGGMVFSRVGSGGEQDLHYYHLSTGVVEIAADVSAVLNRTKTYRGQTTDNRVIFEVTDTASLDLYIWNPSDGLTRSIATTSDDETFAAVTNQNEVVYHVAASSTNQDVRIYTVSTFVDRAIASGSENESFQGALSNGDVVVLREAGSGRELHLFDTSGSSLAGLATTGSDDYTFNKVLASDKVAYTRAGTSGGVFVVNTTGSPSPTQVGAATSSFAAELTADSGDFAVLQPSDGRNVLVLWDESLSATRTVTGATGDDHAFGIGLANGKVLFLRRVAAKSSRDLYEFDPATSTETQLTDGTVDHSVITTYSADNS
ncbi:MAG: hypothetical protein AAF628_35645 [Planctomycetota bacterium]